MRSESNITQIDGVDGIAFECVKPIANGPEFLSERRKRRIGRRMGGYPVRIGCLVGEGSDTLIEIICIAPVSPRAADTGIIIAGTISRFDV